MATMDFIYDLRDKILRKEDDCVIMSFQVGRKRHLKIDVIASIDDDHSIEILLNAIPDISENLHVNKNPLLCPKRFQTICSGLKKQKNFYLVLQIHHGKNRCGIKHFYYLPNKDIVEIAQNVMFDFYKSVEKDVTGDNEESSSPVP